MFSFSYKPAPVMLSAIVLVFSAALASVTSPFAISLPIVSNAAQVLSISFNNPRTNATSICFIAVDTIGSEETLSSKLAAAGVVFNASYLDN